MEDSAIGWIVFLFIAAGIGGCGLAACPHYNVWQAEMSGKAELARAEHNREIRVREARAEKESAELLAVSRVTQATAEAEAEIERARGAAEANRIIADGLGGPEGYLRYLFIDGLKNSGNRIIYVPTEGGLPILEAGRGVSP